MNLLHNDIKLEAAQILKTAIGSLGQDSSLEDIYNDLGLCPKIELGHLAFPCFSFARTLRKAPAMIAKDLQAAIPENDLFSNVEAAGPYLNLKIKLEHLGHLIGEPVLKGSFFKRDLTEATPKTMIEYSQPNTHKELHVGHMRNLALGDALIKMHRYCGYDIVSATFPGDVGTHVAKCLWYMKQVNTDPVPETEKGQWLGKMYSAASIMLEEQLGTDKEAGNRAALTEILKQLEAGEGAYFDLWKETRQWSIDLMNQVYDWADVKFDAWYWESDVDSSSVALIKKWDEEGKLEHSEGATGLTFDPPIGFVMLLKSDGNGNYATKDVELARRKFNENGIEKSIYIVDTRQEGHFRGVFAVLDKMGFEQAKACHHLKYDHVELRDGAMSSRKGNIVPVLKLVAEMEQSILETHCAKSIANGEMTEAEALGIAQTVAKAAIKYGMVKIDTQKKIVFEMEEWIKTTGNSGPYQQYVCARINRLLDKQGYQADGQIDWSLLIEPIEAELLMKVSTFNDVVLAAVQKYQPNMMTNYLYDLGKTLNTFYGKINVKETSDPVLKNSRMAMLDAVRVTVTEGLGLLGIHVPPKM